ncbi:MAG TPA: hypothetical protein VML75_20320, partial [Kofleriaceae bacterium]|nr:hypothetical protein [Kofleriaceae bacterium]
MDTTKRKRSNVLWVLVLLAVVLAWWFLGRGGDEGASQSQIEADRAAALDTDPDDILVDLRDDVTDEQVAALERELGIDLVLVSDQSLDERFYRARVDPAQRDALIAELERRPEVEIAEPDAMVYLDPEVREVVAPPAS